MLSCLEVTLGNLSSGSGNSTALVRRCQAPRLRHRRLLWCRWECGSQAATSHDATSSSGIWCAHHRSSIIYYYIYIIIYIIIYIYIYNNIYNYIYIILLYIYILMTMVITTMACSGAPYPHRSVWHSARIQLGRWAVAATKTSRLEAWSPRSTRCLSMCAALAISIFPRNLTVRHSMA